MRIEIVERPDDLKRLDLSGKTAIVFDVIRATTTILAALANGASGVRVFHEVEQAREARDLFKSPSILAGERGCIAPGGFDLGNSPDSFTREIVAGREVFLSTTNGTRAIHDAMGAKTVLIGALVNASAAARQAVKLGKDVVLLCAGADGLVCEDSDAAATVADVIACLTQVDEDSSTKVLDPWVRRRSWIGAENHRRSELNQMPGAMNLTKAGLGSDVVFCGRLDVFDFCATAKLVEGFIVIQTTV